MVFQYVPGSHPGTALNPRVPHPGLSIETVPVGIPWKTIIKGKGQRIWYWRPLVISWNKPGCLYCITVRNISDADFLTDTKKRGITYKGRIDKPNWLLAAHSSGIIDHSNDRTKHRCWCGSSPNKPEATINGNEICSGEELGGRY